MAGMAACLWQSLPNKTNIEIKTLIENCGSLADTPNFELGYGIPNFYKAYLDGSNQSQSSTDQLLSIYPTIFHDELNVRFHAQVASDWTLTLMDATGKLLFTKTIAVLAGEYVQTKLVSEIESLAVGSYLLKLSSSSGLEEVQKVVKY